MKIAVVGATGLVGTKMIQILTERAGQLPEIEAFYPVASPNSVGKEIKFLDKSYKVITVEDALEKDIDVAIFSAGGSTSLKYAPLFAEKGCYIIDNSSAWRMGENIPLTVPEVNPDSLKKDSYIIANPNCSTIQLVVGLLPLEEKYGLERVIVSTYQSVTGTGVKAVEQLQSERDGAVFSEINQAYPHPIDMNCLPHIDVFLDNGYTKEEIKVMLETRKIMGLNDLNITCTAVRVPVMGGHSESVNITLKNDFNIEDIKELLSNSPGIKLYDSPMENIYPMPILSHDNDHVWVGRIRRDLYNPKTLNMWIVSDNLRKGAATNAIQILEKIVEKGWVN